MMGIGYAGSIYGRYRRHLGLGPHSPIPLPMKGPLIYRFFISLRCITEIMSVRLQITRVVALPEIWRVLQWDI